MPNTMPPNYQTDRQLLQETYRLARENNELIRAMRRGAFIRSLITVIFYAVFFIGPIWFYMTYFSGTVDNLIRSSNQSQGTQPSSSSNSMQDQLKNLAQMLQNFQAAYSGNPPTSTAH